MKKTKIFFYEHFTDLEQKLKQISEFEIIKLEKEQNLLDLESNHKNDYTINSIKKQLSETEYLIIRTFRSISLKILDIFPKLKVILRPGHGYDNIDIPACSSRKCYVFNTAGVFNDSTADLTLGLIINALRFIKDADTILRQGLWEREKFTGRDLRDLNVCIVGLGRVGTAVAKRLLAFGCKIFAVDPYKNPQNLYKISENSSLSLWEQKYFSTVPDISEIIPYVTFLDLKSALKIADVVTLHLPHTAETANMFSDEHFKMMKQGSVFINAARGKIVNEGALYNALVSGHLASGAFDTFATEPPKNSPLLKLPNFTGTPHIGSQTKEATQKVIDAAFKILEKTLIHKDFSDALNFADVFAGNK